MTEQEREELIEKMAKRIDEMRLFQSTNAEIARAALAVAEPVIREQCAKIAENFGNDVSASKYASSFSGKCVISASLGIADAIRERGKDGTT